MEYWNIGMLGKPFSYGLPFSIISLLKFSFNLYLSILPSFHHSIIPFLTHPYSILNDSTRFILAARRAGRRPAPTEVIITTSQDWIRLQTGIEN